MKPAERKQAFILGGKGRGKAFICQYETESKYLFFKLNFTHHIKI